MSALQWIACACACATMFSLLQSLAGCWAVQRHQARRPAFPTSQPAVTVLKPLLGDEPLLEDALASFFVQSYPSYQIVFGVAEANDPALLVVDRLRARHPQVDVAVVVNSLQVGANRKIGNLANMLLAAKHAVLVISDSDIHVRPDYLQAVLSELGRDGTGLVTTAYTGLAASSSLAALLGAAQINQSFLPGALLGRMLGRQDCLGATMALRRETLDTVGGFQVLVDHLADDNRLGRLVRSLGLRVELAATTTATTVPETCLSDLIGHELRWARTMRFVTSAGLACSVLQYPLAWAALTAVLSGGAVSAIVLACLTWLGRALVARELCSILCLGLKPEATLSWWLLPLRDALSVGLIIASFCGDGVLWRGYSLSARDPGPKSSRPRSWDRV